MRQCWRGWVTMCCGGERRRVEEHQFHGAWQWQSGKLLCCPIKLVALCGFRPTHATRSMLHAPRSTMHTPYVQQARRRCTVCHSNFMPHANFAVVASKGSRFFFPAICSQDKRFNYKMRLDACDFLTGEWARHVNKRQGAISGTGAARGCNSPSK